MYCRLLGSTTPVNPLSASYPQDTYPTVYRQGRTHLLQTEDLAGQKTSLVCCTSTPGNVASPCFSFLREIDPGLAIVNSHATIMFSRWIHQLSPPREHPVSSVVSCGVDLLRILRVGVKKLAHIFESHVITQPRRSVSPACPLDFRLQPAVRSASTSLASPSLQDVLRERAALVLLLLL